MIVKKRSIDYKYMGLQMLYNRLPNEHAKKMVIQSKMLSANAGILGEMKVEDVFVQYQFPFCYSVLHNVNLASNGKFQMDTVFISPYCIVILECKNIAGKLAFDIDPACLTRTLESGKIDTYESPEVQIDRNMYLLREWLHMRGINIPVKGVIVLSSTKSKVIKPTNHTDIIYVSSIPTYLGAMQGQKEFLSETKIKEVSQKMLQSHQIYLPYPMCKNWGINPIDLITGVRCAKCERYGMLKKINGWICMSCGNIDRHAHNEAIREWFALVEESISNKECRNFLGINSYQLASRILNSMNLTRSGSSQRTTRYTLEWDRVEKFENLDDNQSM